jgi:hypothetical protein
MNTETTEVHPAEPTNNALPENKHLENPFEEEVAKEAIKPVKTAPNIIKGKKLKPVFIAMIGQPGVGKTTFLAGAPSPICMDVESGADQVGIDRFPAPKTYEEYLEQLDYLEYEKHPHKTIGVDTVDALDGLIIDKTCKELHAESIASIAKGEGYVHAKSIWRKIVMRLKEISYKYNVVLLGHTSITPFNDPRLSAPYDTWKFRINQKCAATIIEAVDAVLYACHETVLAKEKITDKKGKGLVGDRVFHSRPNPAYDCKDRFNLDDPSPLKWSAFKEGVLRFYNNEK